MDEHGVKENSLGCWSTSANVMVPNSCSDRLYTEPPRWTNQHQRQDELPKSVRASGGCSRRLVGSVVDVKW